MLAEAAQLLGLKGSITKADLKTAYRAAAKTHHPDRGGSGDMMKIINAAFDALASALAEYDPLVIPDSENHFDERLKDALEWLQTTQLAYEICGMWIWVSGNTKPHRQELKNHKFRWASRKKKWYFRPPSYRSANRGTWEMDRIRETYGSERAKSKKQKEIEAA